jgi:transcriptional regulator with XRE-family HTH domain
VEASRRSREQRAQLGGEVRRSRVRRNWTQVELADRAGISRHIVGRIERATTQIDVDVLQRIAIAFKRPLEIRFGRDVLEHPADAGHLAMQELVLRFGRTNGYVGDFELPTRPAEPWRSIDVVLASPTRRIMILAECWNTFGDIGAAARSSMRKAAELAAIAAGRWGPDVLVAVVWVVRSTARNRALLACYPEVFAARFPGSSRAWVSALANGGAPPAEPGASCGVTSLPPDWSSGGEPDAGSGV